jgi:hypothetical protein
MEELKEEWRKQHVRISEFGFFITVIKSRRLR